MLQVCEQPGCTAITLGSSCTEHDPPFDRESYQRGRPFRGTTYLEHESGRETDVSPSARASSGIVAVADQSSPPEPTLVAARSEADGWARVAEPRRAVCGSRPSTGPLKPS